MKKILAGLSGLGGVVAAAGRYLGAPFIWVLLGLVVAVLSLIGWVIERFFKVIFTGPAAPADNLTRLIVAYKSGEDKQSAAGASSESAASAGNAHADAVGERRRRWLWRRRG